MDIIGTIREFKTKNFHIIVDAVEEECPDLSWDDTGETQEGLESGKYILFCARVRCYYKGQKLAVDYLGNCIYRSLADFEDHRQCAKQQRKLRKQKGKENVLVGSYFADMVRGVIAEARKALSDRPYIRKAS